MFASPAFRVLRLIVPAVYCGGLIIYFLRDVGSLDGAIQMGLGPTLLGLAIVGGLFFIPLAVAIVRMILGGRRPPGSGGRGYPRDPDDDGGNGFDADAVVKRYLAERSAAGAPTSTPARPASTFGGSAPNQTGFGRRNR